MVGKGLSGSDRGDILVRVGGRYWQIEAWLSLSLHQGRCNQYWQASKKGVAVEGTGLRYGRAVGRDKLFFP